MAPMLRPLAHRTPDTSHINHDPYPRPALMRHQPLPKGRVSLSTPFRLDRLSPSPSCLPQAAEQPMHRSSSIPRSRYSTPIPDSAYMQRRSAEMEVSESEEPDEEPEEEEEEEDRGCPWWCACILLLLGTVLVFGLWRGFAAVKPQSRQPPTHPQSKPMDQCFRAHADKPDAPHLLPRGLRAPLSAMLVTLARDPDSALAWLQSAPMPFAAPVLPDTPEYEELRVTRLDMHEAIWSEYGLGPDPGRALLAWWKRLQAPATLTTPSAGQVAEVERLPPSRLRRWACKWLPNDLTDQYLHLPCAAQARADSPLKALDVMLNLTTLARNSCTPGREQSAADPMAVAQTMAAAESVQKLVLEQVARIAEKESHILHHELEDSNRVSWTDPTSHAAPWYPLGKGSRTGLSGHTMLSGTPRISGAAVPSESSERELNALAAFYAEATWFQLTGAIIEVINDLVTDECRQISSHATKIQEEGLEQLVAAFRRPNANLSSSQLRHLAMSLLRLGLRVLTEKQEQPAQADAKYYTLLEPLIDEKGVFDEHLYSRAGRSKPDYDTIWSIHRTWRRFDHEAETRHSRTALEKMWKGAVLGFGRDWGKERTSSQPETWQTCLRHMAGTASFHRDGTLMANDDGDIGLAQRLAVEAVWTFWHTGASPLWFTNAYRARENGNVEAVESFRYADRDSWSKEGKLYREDLRVSTEALTRMEASDVDMDLVWAWGRQ